MDVRLTHKGRSLAELLVNGSGTLRELSDRIATHLGYPADLFWDTDGPLIQEALADLATGGRIHLEDGRYSLCDHEAS